ncbi:Piso0_002633 [Millerozyma farinosa CBS 7064]|uniref:Piso0_002633 protein n=1 Tax=Pichia sorbitophila (strain ATCC MYA-4447 / BCRC 22081 / CBS 7064 / NBRC 10061 / NRRL Y-12695) TaxID=559304 RepID=G8YD47_PICSO|nr:Piso0_002633 [Millerozyma farinosa CBS 7064]
MDLNNINIFNIDAEVLESLQLLLFDSNAEKVDTNHNEPDFDTEPTKSQSNDLKARQKVIGEPVSDLEKLNQKRSLKGLEKLSETEFEGFLEEQSIDSISGSDTSDNEFEAETGHQIPKMDGILERLDEFSIDNSGDQETSISHLNTRSPLIFFKSKYNANEKCFGVYKEMFSSSGIKDPIKALHTFNEEPCKSGKSAILMIGGGHFAGAIISHTPKDISKNLNIRESKREQAIDIIESKSFHRYTTRRKQGGSQNANDNAKGKANSVGSSIRRYNEQALIQEVRECLNSWASELHNCQFIFIRASGASNRKTLVGYEHGILKSDDKRIRNIPFTTRRPTKSEIKKAWAKLSYMDSYDIPKSDEKKKMIEEKRKEALINSQIEKKKENDYLPSVDEQHSQTLVNFLKKSKAPLLINYIHSHKLSANFGLQPVEKYAHYPSLLHYASAYGLGHMIQSLIVNLNADPTIKNKFGKTPFEVGNYNSRKAFQISRYILGEESHDWDLAKVGPPKPKEEFETIEKQEKEKEENEKRRKIEEELAKKTELELKQPTYSSGGQLSNADASPLISSTSGLTEDQKRAIMREQRARAAEARLKKISGK